MKFKLLLLCISIALFSCNQENKENQSVNRLLSEPGTTYYISETGSNANAGSEAAPWAISKLSSATVKAGDAILIKRGGTYKTGQLVINFTGVTVGAYGTGAAPKIIGSGSKIAYLFYSQKSNNTFRDLEITDPSIDNSDRSIDAKIQRAFTFEGTGNRIINCKISLVGVAAYWIGDGNTMDSCDVGNLRMVVDTDDGNQPGRDDDYGANPIVLSSSNNTITNNYFHDCWANSFDYNFDGGAIEFYNRSGPMNNTTITDNTFVDCIGIAEVTGNASNNNFSRNKIINNGSLCYFQSGYTYNGWNFTNNVIIETKPSRVPESRMIGGAGKTMIFKNNIFQMSNGIDVASSTTGITHSDNIYVMSNNSVIGYSLGSNEYSLPASVFVNTSGEPVGWDYSTKPGTPNIGYVSLSGTVTPPPPTCVPLEEKRTMPCMVNQTGTITQVRKFTCPEGVWTDWVTTASTCIDAPLPTLILTNDNNYIYLNAPKANYYQIWGKKRISSGRYPKGISKIDIRSLSSGSTYSFRTNGTSYEFKK